MAIVLAGSYRIVYLGGWRQRGRYSMGKTRSPNYPAISLPEAVEKVRQVYGKEHQRKMTREVVAKHLGYTGLNGASITAISALLKYGLLEGRGDEIRVSQPAVAILVDPPGAADRMQALEDAAGKPALFAELQKQFDGQVPSADNLQAYLQKQGFTASAASAAGRAYRDTMELVNAEGKAHSPDTMTPPGLEESPPHGGGKPTVRVFNWPLSKDVSAEVRVTGPDIRSDHIERLRQYLDLAKAALEADDG